MLPRVIWPSKLTKMPTTGTTTTTNTRTCESSVAVAAVVVQERAAWRERRTAGHEQQLVGHDEDVRARVRHREERRHLRLVRRAQVVHLVVDCVAQKELARGPRDRQRALALHWHLAVQLQQVRRAAAGAHNEQPAIRRARVSTQPTPPQPQQQRLRTRGSRRTAPSSAPGRKGGTSAPGAARTRATLAP